MTILYAVLWFFVIVFGTNLLYIVYNRYEEGFEDNVKQELITEINNYMTLANDIICPAYQGILDEKINDYLPESQKALSASDQDPDERHKAKALAIHVIAQDTMPIHPITKKPFPLPAIDPTKVQTLKYSPETTGFLFPCPPPTDPMNVPNNIDEYILATSKAILPTLIDMKKNIEKSLSCPPPKTKEKFQDKAISNDSVIQSLQQKAATLNKALSSDVFISLSSYFKELKELKTKAESGSVTSNCAF